MRKDSLVLVAAGPKLAASSVLLVLDQNKKQQAVTQFTVRDLALSRVFYQYQVEASSLEGVLSTPPSSASEFIDANEEEDTTWSPKTDFIQLMFISADNLTVHSVLVEFEIGGYGASDATNSGSSNNVRNAKEGKNDSLLSRSVKGLNGPSIQSKRVRKKNRAFD